MAALILAGQALAGDAPTPPDKLSAAGAVASTPELPPGVPDLARLIDTPYIITASKFEQKTTEAPSSVTVITAADIKHYGYRTLADVLESVPGLYASYDRKHHVLGVRGFSRGDLNSRVLLLINGHRINDSLSDGSDIGTAFPLDVDLIEQVEIIRGPGSVLYGNNAFFGVINVITRRGHDLQGAEVTGEVASYDTYKGRLTYGYRFKNDFEMLFSGTLFDSKGPDYGEVTRTDDATVGSGFGTVRYRDLTLEGAYHKRDKADPTGQYGTIEYDPRFRSIDERSYASLKYAHEFTNVVEVMARLYYDRNDLDVWLPLLSLDLDRDMQVGEWWGSELQLTTRLGDRHTLTLGGEFRHDFNQRWQQYQPWNPEAPPTRDQSAEIRSHGVYMQGDFTLVTNLHLNAGIRYDQYGDQEPTFNPRLALIWNPWSQATIKAIGGTAFRAPNFFERILAGGRPLEPETITTYELAYEQAMGRHLRASVAGFFNQIDDLISFDNGVARNLDSADARGVETSLEGSWANGLRGRLSYSWQQVEDRSTGERFTDSPLHLAKVNVAIPLYRDKILAGVEFQYTSSRKTVYSDLTTAQTPPGRDAAGFATVNLTLFSRELVKGLELSATVYNLFDKRYGDPSTPQHTQDIIQQDGRTFRVKLLYRF